MNNPCPNCGAQILYGARFFCGNCGTHVFGGKRPPSRTTPRRKRPQTRPKDALTEDSPSTDVGAKLADAAGPNDAPERLGDGGRHYDVGSSGQTTEPMAFSYRFTAAVPNDPDRYQRKLEGRFDAGEGAARVCWGKTEGQQESQRATVPTGDLYERLLEVVRRTQTPEQLPPSGGASLVAITRSDGTEISGVPPNADDWDELWRAVAQVVPRRRNWLLWVLGAAILLVACSLLVLLSLVAL